MSLHVLKEVTYLEQPVCAGFFLPNQQVTVANDHHPQVYLRLLIPSPLEKPHL